MSTAATAEHQDTFSTADSATALPLRGDTFLGVFEAVGHDLGFNPNWLRVPFAALLLWNPVAIVVGYLVLGCAVAVARWAFPVQAQQSAPTAATVDKTQTADRREDDELPIAA